MKTLNALICCLAIAFAPLAAAQTQKPPAKGAAPAPAKPAVRPGVELRQDPKRESCERQADERKIRGEALETFMSRCLK